MSVWPSPAATLVTTTFIECVRGGNKDVEQQYLQVGVGRHRQVSERRGNQNICELSWNDRR
eukprot:767818-Hanusia_phi.AAC.4